MLVAKDKRWKVHHFGHLHVNQLGMVLTSWVYRIQTMAIIFSQQLNFFFSSRMLRVDIVRSCLYLIWNPPTILFKDLTIHKYTQAASKLPSCLLMHQNRLYLNENLVWWHFLQVVFSSLCVFL